MQACNRTKPRSRPLCFEFASRKFSQSTRRISDASKLLIDVVEHDPVVAFPMNDGRERHGGEIAQRDFQSASSQSQFGRSPRNRLEASAVGRGVTELSNPWQTYLASEVPANHPQTRGAAIHLVDLHDSDRSCGYACRVCETGRSSSLNGRLPAHAVSLVGCWPSSATLSCTCVSAGSSSVVKSSGTRASVFA